MNKAKKFILGVDPASETFQVALLSSLSEKKPSVPEPFQNNKEGFSALVTFLKSNKASKKNTLICIENTGVYNEELSYFLHKEQWDLTLLHPLEVNRATPISSHKTDRDDAINIAKYSFRNLDRFKLWEPPSELVEKVNQVLSTRELLTKQCTASKNALTSLKRKHAPLKSLVKVLEKNVADLEKQKTKLEKELKALIKEGTPELQQHVSNLESIPGISLLMACYFLVETGGFQKNLEYKKLCSYFGICPFKYESGSSIRRKDKATGHGPKAIRNLLRLASRSVCTHKKQFKIYFQQKLHEGKDKTLIYNNVSNKLVKIMCSIIASNSPYREDFSSINPIFLKR